MRKKDSEFVLLFRIKRIQYNRDEREGQRETEDVPLYGVTKRYSVYYGRF